LSVHRQRKLIHLISSLRDDRENERKRSTTLINDEEKREVKEKEAPKRTSTREKRRAQTYQKQDLRVFLPQPQGGENVVEQSNGQTISMILFGRVFYKETRQFKNQKNACNTRAGETKIKTEVKKNISLLFSKRTFAKSTTKKKPI